MLTIRQIFHENLDSTPRARCLIRKGLQAISLKATNQDLTFFAFYQNGNLRKAQDKLYRKIGLMVKEPPQLSSISPCGPMACPGIEPKQYGQPSLAERISLRLLWH